MTQTPHTQLLSDERAAFHVALSGLQGKMDRSTTIEQALALMPRFGLSWQVTEAGDDGQELCLFHDDGYRQHAYATEGQSLRVALGWLIGLPALLLGPAEPGDEPEAQVGAALQVVPDLKPAEPAPAPATAAAESLAAATAGTVVEEEDPEVQPDPSHSTEPLSDADRETCVDMVKAMNAETRKTFTIAFRDAFNVAREARAVAPLIQERRHLAFVQRFVDEAEGVAAA